MFFPNNHSGDIWKYCAIAIGSIGWVSFFSWILFQYGSLKYAELPFFSGTQALNDSIRILPIILASFVGSILWTIGTYWSVHSKFCQKARFRCWLGILSFWLIYGLWWIQTNKPKWYVELFTNNIDGILIALLINIVSVYAFMMLFSGFFRNMRKDRAVAILVFSTACIGMINSYFSLKSQITEWASTSCVIYEWKAKKFRYANDKYVFIDVRPDSLPKDDNRTFSDIIPISEVEFKASLNCESLNNALLRYFKKDGQCFEMVWHSKDMEHLYTAAWVIKNNGYDLYFSGACTPNPEWKHP